MRIVGLDLGTSSIKAVLFELSENARVIDVKSVAHPLSTPQPGRAEQDGDEALKLSVEVLQQLDWTDVKAVGVSGAMHSLLPLDKNGRPLCAAWTWADVRSAQEARELLERDPDRARRTGTPIHPMAWPSKLAWMQRNDAKMFGSAALFVGIKEYVVHGLVGGDMVMDRSIASGTGCYDIEKSAWEDSTRMPKVVDTDFSPGKLNVDGLPEIPLVLAGGDGPLSNLGSGADEPDLVAISIGTSGAVRVISKGAQSDPRGRLFCYYLGADEWVRGGAISNGTLAIEWLRSLTGKEQSVEDLVKEGCDHESDGLLFLPYLAGERAPNWNPAAQGVFFGLGLTHKRGHLARAVLEGIAFALKDVFSRGNLARGVREARVCGGLTHSREWMQILADILEIPVASVVSPEAAALGAAMIAARAVGHKQKARLEALETFRPASGAKYGAAFAEYQALYPALESHFGWNSR